MPQVGLINANLESASGCFMQELSSGFSDEYIRTYTHVYIQRYIPTYVHLYMDKYVDFLECDLHGLRVSRFLLISTTPVRLES